MYVLEERNTYLVYFWDNEIIYEPPATRSVNITWTGMLEKATLYVEIGRDCVGRPWTLNRITFNGNTVWSGRTTGAVSVDVTDLITKGSNHLRLDYEIPIPYFPACGARCTAYLEMVISGGEVKPIKPPGPAPFPWESILYGGLVIAGIVAVAYLIRAVRR